jgi:chromosome segregation ATPase
VDENEIRAIQEENETLKGEKEAATAELEQLKGRLTERDAAFTPLREEMEQLKDDFIVKGTELKALGETTSTLGDSLTEAITAYKGLVIQANPGLTSELITGETVDKVNASLEKAKGVIEAVRKSLEAERAGAKVPAGAPPRTPPDLSSLSPIEKIKHAIGGNTK